MASIAMQRDLVIILKRETLLNLKLLSKIVPLTVDLSRQVFKENALEKLTQNVFNHLSYYLVAIIDLQVFAALPWPLYDSKTERVYRNDLASFIAECSNKGLLSPVMSSYLVNPACYKVTVLIFQMTQLAVQRVLASKMDKEHQKTLYNEMTEKYKSQNTHEFISGIDKTTAIMLSKFSNYLCKRRATEQIAEIMKNRILSMEKCLNELQPQEFIDKLVDNFLKENKMDDKTKTDFLTIKNVAKPSPFFDRWLSLVDEKIDDLESKWENKITPFLNICKETLDNSKTLISRHTGEVDRKTFTLEFNPQTDVICTKDLESQVNSEQTYILKNIVKDGRLNFPNLIRGFLVSISVIMKNAEVGDEVYKFNEYLENGCRSYNEIVSELRNITEQVMDAESRLQNTPQIYNESVSMGDLMEIPPVPDLSEIKMSRDFHSTTIFDTFTPWNLRKHQFNLGTRSSSVHSSFSRPMPKFLVTPFQHTTRSDILSCRVSAYDQANSTANMLNLSIMSTAASRGNETIGQSSGFTKQQIHRLLSTRKSSSSKKQRFKMDRPHFHIKKGALFNESNTLNESVALLRSQSSPNLFENRDKRSVRNLVTRKLSIMKENSPSLLEVSGIAALERDSNQSTPQSATPTDTCRKLIDASSMPLISTSTEKANSMLSSTEIENSEGRINSITGDERVSKILSLTEIDNRDADEISKILSSTEINSSKNSPIVTEIPIQIDSPPRKSWDEVEASKESVIQIEKVTRISWNEVEDSRKSLQLEKNQRISWAVEEKSVQVETPKTNTHVKPKTSSLEKIISRFKKVRASVYPSDLENIPKEINTITEEKENVYNIDMIATNRVLLPDLLSPSCNLLSTSCTNFMDDFDDEDMEARPRRPRESLGTALGVDHTFLDQFELVD